nr:type II toxin-antitoxin system RelE/ParE family toxin [Proteiniphilum sp. X52]
MEEADKFIAGLDSIIVRKIFYNIDLAEQTNDPKLFKKLQSGIWEFRTRYAGLHVNEIDRAISLRDEYFKNKLKK